MRVFMSLCHLDKKKADIDALHLWSTANVNPLKLDQLFSSDKPGLAAIEACFIVGGWGGAAKIDVSSNFCIQKLRLNDANMMMKTNSVHI